MEYSNTHTHMVKALKQHDERSMMSTTLYYSLYLHVALVALSCNFFLLKKTLIFLKYYKIHI